MTDAPFHATRMGQRFYEHTAPELVRQVTRLNDNLERLIDAAEPKEDSDDYDDKDEEQREDLDPEAPQDTNARTDGR